MGESDYLSRFSTNFVDERRGFVLREKSDREHVMFHRRSLSRFIREDSIQKNLFEYSSSALQESVQEIIAGKILDSSHSSFGSFSCDPALDVLDRKRPSKKESPTDQVCAHKNEFSDDICDHPYDYMDSTPQTGKSMMEVAPGVTVPLRGSTETWEAIKDGRVTVTACCACQLELHCIEDAEFVICPDCWVVSSVDQTFGGIPLENEDMAEFDGGKRPTCRGVGLGVKAVEVVEWLEAGY